MNEDGKYIGEVKKGKPNGREKLFYIGSYDGDLYEGDFKDGELMAKGNILIKIEIYMMAIL